MSLFDDKYLFVSRFYLIISQILYKKAFGSFGRHSRIIKPLRIINSKYMNVGDGVYIDQKSYLIVDDSFKKNPTFNIKNNVKIGNFNHIACANYLSIEDDVLTADRVYISDNYHIYSDVNMPIRNQGIASKGAVIIGEGSWIGDNVSIISCRIGKHCVIGANSVVTHDIPDYCVAVGCPAKIVRKYNKETDSWEKV